MDEVEEWRPVVGFEGLYEVSSLGRVRSLDRYVHVAGARPRFKLGQMLRQSLRKDGYLKVGLHRTGEMVRESPIHRLVCEAFHGPAVAGLDAAHGDGNRRNNRSDNLRWATRSENMADKVKHGTHQRGERAHGVKLAVEDVRFIRARLAAGVKQRDLSRLFKVSPSAINLIAKGTNWAWLE